MALQFNCPNCNTEITVSHLELGVKVTKCGACGAKVLVSENPKEVALIEKSEEPVTAEVATSEKLDEHVTAEAPTSVPSERAVGAGMFNEADYIPFMLGVFLAGGLLVIPLTWGLGVGLGYFATLPWSLASCVVFLIAFRRNGTISWGRAIVAIGAIVLAASAYSQNTGKPSFAAGGILGFIVLVGCGYVGIGIGRIVRRK